jgi:hypothetical protein
MAKIDCFRDNLSEEEFNAIEQRLQKKTGRKSKSH